MPTGYTAKLCEGQEQNVRDFILTCARAFTPTIRQRDEATDVPPRLIELDTARYDEQVTAARRVLEEAPTWTYEEAHRRAWEMHKQAMQAWSDTKDEQLVRRRRYEAMLEAVEGWVPPAADHRPLKDFMVEQLRGAIDFDCKPYDPPVAPSVEEYRANVILRARRDVAYYEKERREETARVDWANDWISVLYDSLPS